MKGSDNMPGDVGLWVFAYGSLIWNPGFTPVHRESALLRGYHRSFCMSSVHYRGTAEAPGLVLALDRLDGASCQGIALGVRRDDRDQVLDDLRERELVSSAYLEAWLPVRLASGREVEAVVYVVDPEHDQYCGGLSRDDQARIIARAHGHRGPNREYLENTAAHLHELGLPDADLDWLVAEVTKLG
ncbi:MAG: gamma-glutamylcyclotransferase [Pseudomonadota bacterium]